ncbi:hypothetical protein GV819_15970 [Pseudomonas sp. Fl5BN2]|uniref:hypothetical protein n=1 Tax=Pseudomonas sp. Fl5BN2 TaxID=2697652 RepID=UPI0013783966|nr:hypothetical protein [Pseudomonas sp. Fl5BN2]NBF03791.1 hypothetical protein [Pseudomonas sp. Fl5BN2]
MNLKEIKFYAQHPTKEGLIETVFRLGQGPCKRWVERLSVEITLAALTIVQESHEEDYSALENDYYKRLRAGALDTEVRAMNEHLHRLRATRETKRFVYKLEEIHGRITAIEA